MSSEKIEQNWDVTVVNDNPIFPFVVIDNWYTPNEEKAVWKELDFFSVTPKDQIERAEKGVVARFKDGTSKSKAYRFYINQFYEKPEISPILNCMYKQKTPEFHKIIEVSVCHMLVLLHLLILIVVCYLITKKMITINLTMMYIHGLV